jgi:hypothetical protein
MRGRRYAIVAVLAIAAAGLILASVFFFSDWLVPSPGKAGQDIACDIERELRMRGDLPPMMTDEQFADCQ